MEEPNGKLVRLIYHAAIPLIILGMCLPLLLRWGGFNIYRYANDGDVGRIRSYLHQHPDQIDRSGYPYFLLNKEGPYPPLMWAARRGHLEAVSELVNSGAD